MHRCCRTLAIILALAGFVTTNHAEDQAAENPLHRLELNDMVIVATSGEREIPRLPYTVYNLRPDDHSLSLSPAIFPQLLEDVPGAMMQKTGNGMTSPYLRGFTSQRTVLLADGVRVNNAILREGPNQYWSLLDAMYYDQVEVLMGPNSLLYGSDAIGGTVIARKSLLERGIGDDLQWQGGELSTRLASAERSIGSHLEGNFAVGDAWSFNLGLTYQNFGTLHSGNDREHPDTNFDQYAGHLRGVYWFTDDHRLVFGLDTMDQNDVDRVHRTVSHVDYSGTLNKGNATDLARTYDHQRQLAFARYEMRQGEGAISEADLTLSWQFIGEDYRRVRGDTSQNLRETDTDSLGLELRLESPSAVGTWTYGGDWQHDSVDSTGVDINLAGVATPRIQGQVGDDSTYDLAGVFVQNELPLGDRFELITGLRYSYAELDAGHVNFNGVDRGLQGDWSELVGSARLLWRALPDNRLNLYTGIAQGFRAPNLSDATRDGDFGGGLETPTANLDAEHFLTYEIGAKRVADGVRLEVAGYRTEIEDRIFRLNAPVATKRNAPEGYVHGIEGRLDVDLHDDYTWYNRFSWQEGQESVWANRDLTQPIVERPLSRMNPFTATTGLRWKPAASPFWAAAEVEHAEEQDQYTDAEVADNRFPPGGTPSWSVVNLIVGWSPTDDLDLSVFVENISDEDYRVHGSGVNEPGRNFGLNMAYRF